MNENETVSDDDTVVQEVPLPRSVTRRRVKSDEEVTQPMPLTTMAELVESDGIPNKVRPERARRITRPNGSRGWGPRCAVVVR